jgi:hypothetical protein
MSGWAYDGTTWRAISELKVYDGGTWRTVSDAWVYDGATWRQWYTSGPSISSITSWFVNVTCDKASPGAWFRSYCNVLNWDGGTYRLDAYSRRYVGITCTGSYVLFASDVTVTSGQSATQEYEECTDCEYNTSYDYRVSYQWEWRIYVRSGGALYDSLADSCDTEPILYCEP